MSTPYYDDGTVTIYVGDCREVLPQLAAAAVHTCITSPPYFGLRDYQGDKQIGLESTPAAYVAEMTGVFEEVRRVLRSDGTTWLNLGDSYNGMKAGNTNGGASSGLKNDGRPETSRQRTNAAFASDMSTMQFRKPLIEGLKPKDLIGIPWRVAFALQDAGWYLRSDIIWAKGNPMPESVTDRPTKSHEYLFLLAKAERYHYDAAAIAEAVITENWKAATGSNRNNADVTLRHDNNRHGGGQLGNPHSRNKRSVWTINTQPYAGAHFAVFPEKLIEPCILAGCPPGGIVLDPFLGSGTTARVAKRLGRRCIGIEQNEAYAEMAAASLAQEVLALW